MIPPHRIPLRLYPRYMDGSWLPVGRRYWFRGRRYIISREQMSKLSQHPPPRYYTENGQ